MEGTFDEFAKPKKGDSAMYPGEGKKDGLDLTASRENHPDEFRLFKETETIDKMHSTELLMPNQRGTTSGKSKFR